ncbi:hypothetical protein CL617_02490 [archaeon]|nr:hypothetical protein [archaeon]|tara:strand:+ start:6477 stop:6977 length:501 start_codon:yes stop_codon:yes gene_type:complete
MGLEFDIKIIPFDKGYEPTKEEIKTEIKNIVSGLLELGEFYSSPLEKEMKEIPEKEVLEYFDSPMEKNYVFSFDLTKTLSSGDYPNEEETWGYFYPKWDSKLNELQLNAASTSLIRICKEWENSEKFLNKVFEIIAKKTECKKVALWNDHSDNVDDYDIVYEYEKN